MQVSKVVWRAHSRRALGCCRGWMDGGGGIRPWGMMLDACNIGGRRACMMDGGDLACRRGGSGRGSQSGAEDVQGGAAARAGAGPQARRLRSRVRELTALCCASFPGPQ